MTLSSPSTTYRSLGVDTRKEGQALGGLLGWLNKTFDFPSPTGKPALGNGFFATVHDLGNDLGIAVGTDGVGTKLLIAEAMSRYDTVGIDLIAMNANDVLCLGARPFALVDYLAVQSVRPKVLEALGKGLYEGARQARIAIAGGELAQVPDLIKGLREGEGFDIAGTCLGVVQISKIIDGRAIQQGDIVIGFASSGVHSNGLTMARKILLEEKGLSLEEELPQLGCSLGDELLRPTLIYVDPILQALDEGCEISGLAHITSEGFGNLLRLKTELGFRLDRVPEAPPIFKLIQELGPVDAEEMYEVFNMGVGFCAVVRATSAERLLSIADALKYKAMVIGEMRGDIGQRVELPSLGLVRDRNGFRRV